jgi:putative thiamine transport system permease protein
MKNAFAVPWLKVIPPLTTAVFLIPVLLGLLGTWLPSFGYFPAIGLSELSLEPWRQLAQHPSFYSATVRTFVTGIGASLFAFVFLLILLIGLYPSRFFSWIEQTLSPILSVPHAAFAIGLGFLITPSGWLVRIIELFTHTLPQPPLWTTFQDPWGISLIFALTAKELPFLLFMSLAVLPSLKVTKTIWLANSMGHTRRYAWLWLITPQLYRQIKLPFFAVVAYSMTVVDIAIIAGPTTPPTLAVLITQLFNDPNLMLRTVGAAGATQLLIIVIITLLSIHGLEQLLRFIRTLVLNRGRARYRDWPVEKVFAKTLALLFGATYICAFIVTLIWSFTQRWRYPEILPTQWSFRSWQRIIDRIGEPFWCTLLLAVLSASIAIVLVTLALENEVRLKRLNKKVNPNTIMWLVYLPLLIPQIAFIFGFQITLIQLHIDGTFGALLWSHLVFVLPYVFLTLSGPYRRYDIRYSWQAISLSQQPNLVYWRVKFPILMRPFLYAFATGFSVSIAQYLPTLFVGAGKFTTVTTEAVAMASGSDRRMMAVLALWQQLLPFIVFALATIIPAIRFRHRLAMKLQ